MFRCKWGKFFIPCDFVFMEIEEDSCIPIILGEPLLAIVEAMINVKNDKLSLQAGEEKVELSLPQSITSPILDDTCCRADM